jgi:hypothetical protein
LNSFIRVRKKQGVLIKNDKNSLFLIKKKRSIAPVEKSVRIFQLLQQPLFVTIQSQANCKWESESLPFL